MPQAASLAVGFSATDDTGATYEADISGSNWSTIVDAGGVASGTIKLDGVPAPDARTLSISLSTGFNDISVTGITLPG